MRILVFLVWVIDILNINFVVNGIEVAELLDVTIPINTLAWILIWIFMPSKD